MPDVDGWEQWEGRTIVGNDGQRVGRISQVYLDHETGRPTWGSVHTGLLGAGQAFVPLHTGRRQGEAFQVPYAAQLCKDAPRLTEDAELTHADQRRLFEHYGIGAQRPPAPAAQSRDEQAEVAGTSESMTGLEERGRLGVVRPPGETGRLPKRAVSAPDSQTVAVRREEVRIERKPITQATRPEPADGYRLGEEVHELTLMHEEPVPE